MGFEPRLESVWEIKTSEGRDLCYPFMEDKIDYEKMSVYEQILCGLNESIDKCLVDLDQKEDTVEDNK